MKYNLSVKKQLLLLFIVIGFIGTANADGVVIQNIDFNINKLKKLNQCMGCDLRSTNFNGANLTGANLLGAKLSLKNFKGVIFSKTIMPDGKVRN